MQPRLRTPLTFSSGRPRIRRTSCRKAGPWLPEPPTSSTRAFQAAGGYFYKLRAVNAAGASAWAGFTGLTDHVYVPDVPGIDADIRACGDYEIKISEVEDCVRGEMRTYAVFMVTVRICQTVNGLVLTCGTFLFTAPQSPRRFPTRATHRFRRRGTPTDPFGFRPPGRGSHRGYGRRILQTFPRSSAGISERVRMEWSKRFCIGILRTAEKSLTIGAITTATRSPGIDHSIG